MTFPRPPAFRLLGILAVLIVALSATLLPTAYAQSSKAPLKIAMILWRGETNVEQGFRAYFDENNIPVDLTIHDVARDLSRVPAIIDQIRKDPPDLVYTWGTGITSSVVGKYDAVDPAKNITDLPVVYVMVSPPWKTGIAAPAGQSRPNVTGATHIALENRYCRACGPKPPQCHRGNPHRPACRPDQCHPRLSPDG